jgi:hypothetical protein
LVLNPTSYTIIHQVETVELLERKEQGGIQVPISQLLIPYAVKIEYGDSTCTAVALNIFPLATVGVGYSPGGKGGAVGIVKRIFEVQQSDPLFLQATKSHPSLQRNRYH